MSLPVSALFSLPGRTAAQSLGAEYCGRLQKHFFDKRVTSIRTGDEITANVAKRDRSTWPREAKAVGIAGATRGALGHWVKIRDGRIESCRCAGPWPGRVFDVVARGVPDGIGVYRQHGPAGSSAGWDVREDAPSRFGKEESMPSRRTPARMRLDSPGSGVMVDGHP